MKGNVADLIERLEKTEGPSRELDAEIARVVLGRTVGVAKYTSSLDAAVAFVARALPGWRWGVTQGSTDEDDFQGNVWPSGQPFPAELDVFAYHKSAPIALVIATLKARAVQENRA